MISRFKGELGLAVISTFLTRGLVSLGSIFLGIIIGRKYGSDGVGTFALAQSIMLGACILARFGMDNALMRFVGRDFKSGLSITYLRLAFIRALFYSLAISYLTYLARHWLSGALNSPELKNVLTPFILSITPMTLAFILAGFMKGIRKPVSATTLENGSVSLIASALILFVGNLNSSISLSQAGWFFCLAAWVISIQGLFKIGLWMRRELSALDTATQFKSNNSILASHTEFMSSSKSFFILSLGQFVQQFVVVMIAGILLSTSELGMFKVAERCTILISFTLIVANSVFPPRFASLFHEGKLKELSKLVRQSSKISLFMAFPILLLYLIMPQWILILFGTDFIGGENLVRVISIAHLVNIATGSVGFLLSMTGHEHIMRNITLTTSAFEIMAFLFLIPIFGSMGAAISLSISLISKNLLAVFFAWKKLKIWSLPIPNPIKAII